MQGAGSSLAHNTNVEKNVEKEVAADSSAYCLAAGA